MSEHNFADLWEQIADAFPDAPAQIHGERRQTWREFDKRADGVAKALLDLGVEKQDKVAQYLYNTPEFLESLYGSVKAALVPVNTNYRYSSDELVYLWDNADAVAVVFHGTFAERIEEIRSRVPKVRLWLWVDDGSGPCPDWATPYEDAASQETGRVTPPWGRSGDDIYMLYTGGTTGMPKGVMWRMGDLIDVYASSTVPNQTWSMPAAPGPKHIPACPLMHGTGSFTAFIALNLAGCIVTLTKRNYDPVELLETIEREKVAMMAIVGDAFAKPMLAALDADPGRYDLSSLFAVISSGVMWSEETKQGLLKHHPAMILQDAFSSSEALGMGTSISTGSGVSHTAKFTLSENTKVLSEDGTREIEPGSGEIGLLAVKGHTPIGYYKDPEKSAKTFKVIDGARYSIPGDYATIETDGSLTVLGRGSVCINTAGEKVFPEEVEEVIKRHDAVMDSAVVGVPDEKWGEAITAVVVLRDGRSATTDEVIAHVKANLASYKAPKRVMFVDSLGRSPAGKLDYPGLREKALAELSAPA
jgi:fatty-acyl-CoA synthase